MRLDSGLAAMRTAAAARVLRRWPLVPGRWRVASLLIAGDLRGGESVSKRVLPVLDGEVVRGRFGVRVRIRPGPEYVSPFVFGDHEPITSRILRALLRPGDVAVDVGANYGWFTALFARSVTPRGKVIAVEPLPRFTRELRQTIGLNGVAGIVEVEECALGNTEGESVMYTFDGMPGSHASSDPLGRADAEATTCARSTLDVVLGKSGVKRVDLIKVDVEGDERNVFRGARRVLSGVPGPVVHFEVNHHCLTARGLSAADVFEPLRETGYSDLWKIDARGGVAGRVTKVLAPLESIDADYVAAKRPAAPRVREALRQTGWWYRWARPRVRTNRPQDRTARPDVQANRHSA